MEAERVYRAVRAASLSPIRGRIRDHGVRRVSMIVLTVLLLGSALVPIATAQQATPISSADAAAELTALFAGPGVVFRAPENCVNDQRDPYNDPTTLAFCAVKDVVGALGGPSSGAAVTDFVEAPNRFEFNQPEDCETVGAVADGKHDNCAVVTGAATLLHEGLPVRLFGVCGKAEPKDCSVLGTITDPNWKPDGVYLLMDLAKVTIHCQYAQDAGRNGCNENEAYTAGQERPLCSEDATNPECQYGADETEAMLAAYTTYCTDDAENCLENQLEADWGIESVIAIGYMNRGDQAWDCEDSRTKAEHFTEAVNTAWSTDLPTVQLFIDVANNQERFGDAETGCEPPPAP
jgi:hypothetical protein